jgi:hypothetical protein
MPEASELFRAMFHAEEANRSQYHSDKHMKA